MLEMTALEKTHPGTISECENVYMFSAYRMVFHQKSNNESYVLFMILWSCEHCLMNRSTVHRWLLSQSERATKQANAKKWLPLNVHRGIRVSTLSHTTLSISVWYSTVLIFLPVKGIPINVLLLFSKLIHIRI